MLDIARATGEFAEAIALRHKLAYTAPDEVDDDQVWDTSVDDAPVLAEAVTQTLAALDGQ